MRISPVMSYSANKNHNTKQNKQTSFKAISLPIGQDGRELARNIGKLRKAFGFETWAQFKKHWEKIAPGRFCDCYECLTNQSAHLIIPKQIEQDPECASILKKNVLLFTLSELNNVRWARTDMGPFNQLKELIQDAKTPTGDELEKSFKIKAKIDDEINRAHSEIERVVKSLAGTQPE